MPKVTKDTNKEEKMDKKETNVKSKTITSTTKKKVEKSSSRITAKSSKKVSNTKTSTNKTTSTRSKVTKSTTSKSKKLDSSIVAEYYDLPYRYNETIVKVLYQTPNILFVYWDVSDEDRQAFTSKYGENFFNATYPVLKIYNLTKSYDFEVPINDFANSWYINVNDAGCDYKVELFRKPIEQASNEYIYVSSSNDIQFPNDHILLEELPNSIDFKNIKTNEITSKDISTLHLIGIKSIHNISDFYKKLYKDEILDEINNNRIINPSSSS